MKNLFAVLALIIVLFSCQQREEVRPVEKVTPVSKPKYLDTCSCRFDDLMRGKLPADSCGAIKVTDLDKVFGGTGLPSGNLNNGDILNGGI